MITATYEDCMAAQTDVLVVIEAIRVAQQLANANRLTDYSTWGSLKTVLVQTLAAHLVESRQWSVGRARRVAKRVVELTYECGENVRYCLDLVDAEVRTEPGLPTWGTKGSGY